MEALRAVTEHLHAATGAIDEELPRLLALGCERFGLETGLLVECDASARATVRAVHCPDDVELARGPFPHCDATAVGRALASDRVVAIQRASEGHWSLHPEHAPHGWASFLGVRLPALDADRAAEPARVLCFADRRERAERFSGVEQSLLGLIADWLAPRLVSTGAAAPADGSEKALAEVHPRPQQPRPQQPGPRRPSATAPAAAEARREAARPPAEGAEQAEALEPNAALRALRPALRRALGLAHELSLDLAPTVPAVRMTRARFDRFVESLVVHAAEAVPSGGAITVRTATADAPEEAPDDAVAFATVSVCAQGAALGSDELAALYGSGGDGDASGRRRLPLSRLVRVLRDHGGDLSLESEEGVGTTLTAYLAAAPAPGARGGARAGEAAPRPADDGLAAQGDAPPA